MRIKPVFGLAVVGYMLCSCQSDSYQINGFARQLPEGDTIVLAQEEMPSQPLGYDIVSEGRFLITGTSDTPSLCRVYQKRDPSCVVNCFLEPGTITVELNPPPALSRVSGTRLNNTWQQMNDSIQLLGRELIRITAAKSSDRAAHLTRLNAVDSLHRKMSDCILNTARQNQDNALGKYILQNYKEPKFN